MTGLVAFYRPEAAGVGSQHLIGKNNLAVLIQAEFKRGIGNDDASGACVIGTLDIKGNGCVLDLLRIFLTVAGECLLKNFNALLVGDVLVVITDFCLGAGSLDRLRQLVAFLQAFRKLNAADSAVFLVALPAGAGDVAAHDALDGDHGQLAAQHAASAELLRAEERRHIIYIYTEHVIRDHIFGIVKPETGHLGQNPALVGYLVLQNYVKCRDTIGGIHDQRIADVVNLAYFSFLDRTKLLHVFLLMCRSAAVLNDSPQLKV